MPHYPLQKSIEIDRFENPRLSHRLWRCRHSTKLTLTITKPTLTPVAEDPLKNPQLSTWKLFRDVKKRSPKLNIHSQSSETENRRGILINIECRPYLRLPQSGARSVAAAMQKSWHRHDSSFCHQLVKMSGRFWKKHVFLFFLIYLI